MRKKLSSRPPEDSGTRTIRPSSVSVMDHPLVIGPAAGADDARGKAGGA
jgi:hypothetical protein